MTESVSCEIFSHPDKKLRDHLTSVADFCSSTNSEAKPDFSSLGFTNETLTIFSRMLGLCHDFGKSTSYFQKYLVADEKEKVKLKIKPETQHGLISAVFTYHCLKENLKGKPDGEGSLLPLIGYVIVRRHHGNLKNFFEETTDIRSSEKIDVLKRQCASISNVSLFEAYHGYISETTIIDFFSGLDSVIASIIQDGKLFSLKPRLGKISPAPTLEIFTLFYYSLLLAGDKLDAADLSSVRRTKEIRADFVDLYREQCGFVTPASGINRIRNEIYEEVISKVDVLDLNQRIYSLNVPTGTGKTLTSVSFALKLRERISKETIVVPRVIYCLPFMSIIDQNYDVIAKVFSYTYGKDIPTDVLLKHHHLADLSYDTDEDNFEEDDARLLIEGWHSEFIITTFVQFFHTILSNKNRAIRKYHTLANAIVILDEVQSIPHEYWLLFHDVIQTMTKCLKMYVVFVTATQPLIFDEQKAGEIIELAQKKKIYFSQLDRVTLEFNNESQNLEEFTEKVQHHLITEPTKDFLVVLNTINTAKEVFVHLSELADNTEYVFLSTHIIPKERLERIRKIREKCNKRRVIVSTQLIESGVDIDVDIVYRDMAPLDSLNQVAGRCNRNNRQGSTGEVHIVTLKDKRKKICEYIYSQFLLDKTRIVFEGKTIVAEQQFFELNNQYYRLVEELHSNDPAYDCLTLLRYLKFSDLQDTFHLIKNDYPKMDLFIECDEQSQELWRRFTEIKTKPFPDRRSEFLKIKKDFLDHVISVPKNMAQRLFREDLGIGYISRDELNIWYNSTTGFTPNDGGTRVI